MIDVEVNVTKVAAVENAQFYRLREVLLALPVPLVDRTDRMNAEEELLQLVAVRTDDATH